ncbi:TraA family conjugative transfer protein [Proteus mirabilis]|uniref:TraA family conjugative transfer protein n=3 Tax=Enterobacterales TaxID=91347 RepID=UPI0034DD4AD1
MIVVCCQFNTVNIEGLDMQLVKTCAMPKIDTKKVLFVVLAVLCIAALAVMFAYGKGTEQSGFKEVWMQITAYMQGSLGRVLVGLIVVVGIAAAVVRQSLMTFAVAVGAAIGLYYAPDIINGIMTSSVAVTTVLPVL